MWVFAEAGTGTGRGREGERGKRGRAGDSGRLRLDRIKQSDFRLRMFARLAVQTGRGVGGGNVD